MWSITCHNLILKNKLLYYPQLHKTIVSDLHHKWQQYKFFNQTFSFRHQLKQGTQNSLFFFFFLHYETAFAVKHIQRVFLLARCHVSLKWRNTTLQLVVQGRLKTFLAVLLIQTISCARASVEHFILERHLHITEKNWLGG
jgi:hypothetical protein